MNTSLYELLADIKEDNRRLNLLPPDSIFESVTLNNKTSAAKPVLFSSRLYEELAAMGIHGNTVHLEPSPSLSSFLGSRLEHPVTHFEMEEINPGKLTIKVKVNDLHSPGYKIAEMLKETFYKVVSSNHKPEVEET